jgi:VanZ family protein
VRKVYFWAAVIWTSVITVSCLVSMRTFDGIDIGNGKDKYVHGFFYFLLTFLWYQYTRRKFTVTAAGLRLRVFLCMFLFGLCIELAQSLFTKDRSADWHDVIANSSGSLIAILYFWLTEKLKK